MKRLILTSCLCVLFASCTALADWNVSDPHKMHFPQLPDADGWDVKFDTEFVPQLADDWLCIESSEVSDVHLWYSWKDDSAGELEKVQLAIWSDSPDPDEDGPLFSKPDYRVWDYRDFYPGEGPDTFTIRQMGKADQGWFDPANPDSYDEHNHSDMYQLNIEEITNPFAQVEGEIYWLSVCFYLVTGDANLPGWKTADVDKYPAPETGSKFRDDAVWWNGNDDTWNELHDPITGDSLDLAFVITPEPATISLLGLGSMVLLRKKRRV